jgi:hypothetical protein
MTTTMEQAVIMERYVQLLNGFVNNLVLEVK